MITSHTHARPFYPALDGLRAIAFLSVFFYHYAPYISTARVLNWGWIGVDIFFVLSGFLITGILFDSLNDPHYFRNFYIRRSLRIFPLAIGFWLLMALLTPFLGIVWNRYNLALVAYVGNFFYAGSYLKLHPHPGLLVCLRLLPKGVVTPLDALPLWSLCIEEQFYLVWPAIVWLLRSRNFLLRLCFGAVLICPLLRVLYWRLSPATAAHAATYFNTVTRLDTLLMGAAIALVLRGPGVSQRRLQRSAYLLLFAPLPILALLIARFSPPSTEGLAINWINDPVTNTIGLSLVGLFSVGLLLLAIDETSWLYRLLHTQLLTQVGRRSYGLYLLHAVPLFVFAAYVLPRLHRHHLNLCFPPLALVYTFAAGWLSFRYLESPFLRLKDRLAPRQQPNAGQPPM